MLWRLLLGVALALTIGAAVAAPKLMNNRTDVVLRQPVPATPRIQVQQTLIRAAETVETRQSAPSSRNTSRVPRSASAKPPTGTFIARAARTLVGDGRYRPEPFPRAR
jgi:hypothetical protein